MPSGRSFRCVLRCCLLRPGLFGLALRTRLWSRTSQRLEPARDSENRTQGEFLARQAQDLTPQSRDSPLGHCKVSPLNPPPPLQSLNALMRLSEPVVRVRRTRRTRACKTEPKSRGMGHRTKCADTRPAPWAGGGGVEKRGWEPSGGSSLCRFLPQSAREKTKKKEKRKKERTACLALAQATTHRTTPTGHRRSPAPRLFQSQGRRRRASKIHSGWVRFPAFFPPGRPTRHDVGTPLARRGGRRRHPLQSGGLTVCLLMSGEAQPNNKPYNVTWRTSTLVCVVWICTAHAAAGVPCQFCFSRVAGAAELGGYPGFSPGRASAGPGRETRVQTENPWRC